MLAGFNSGNRSASCLTKQVLPTPQRALSGRTRKINHKLNDHAKIKAFDRCSFTNHNCSEQHAKPKHYAAAVQTKLEVT